MQVVLNNVDSSFLPVLESFKAIMPGLEIIKEPRAYDNGEIKERLSAQILQIEGGDTDGYATEDMRAKFGL